MKKRRSTVLKLTGDAAFVAAITLANRYMEKSEGTWVKRDGDEKRLNRQLALVNIIYHAIGIFYNE